MKEYIKHLEQLRLIKRKHYHPLVHKIHGKHKISRKTLFYVKEYGPHTNVPGRIIKESIKILILASLISSFGGLALENIKTLFVSIIPLVILFPTLNDLIGDYGTIISSKFSAMLHEGKVKTSWWKNAGLKKLFLQVFIISLFTTIFSTAAALIISSTQNYALDFTVASKVFLIAIIDVTALISLLFLVSIAEGIYLYKKNEDPNNFLIPITTSMADFGNIIILTVLVIVVF